MPLNIAIDVDGTLLGDGENPAPNIRERLQNLKRQGHHLQLWSTGGAAYALRKATEHGLADLFESFGTKPDVAFDDLPESVYPAATIKIDESFPLADGLEMLRLEVEPCVESGLCPSTSLKAQIAAMQQEGEQVRSILGGLVRDGTPFHPIPFFGNIESARVITVGLNPAITEFADHRRWMPNLNAEELALRLVNYFRLAGVCYPVPHSWFGEIVEFLDIVGCPGGIAAAHVDLCPWTSVAPIGLTAEQRTRFWGLVDQQMERWLAKTLAHAQRTARLVIIMESPQPRQSERQRQTRTKEIIEEALGANCIVEIKKQKELVNWALANRPSLEGLIGLSRVVG